MNKPGTLTIALAIAFSVQSIAEISGSGFHGINCGGEIQLEYFVNNNGDHGDSSDGDSLAGIVVSIMRVSDPSLGTVTLTTDDEGVVEFENLCSDNYQISMDSGSMPTGLDLSAIINDETDTDILVGSGSDPLIVPFDEDDEDSLELAFVYQDAECALDIAAGCAPAASPDVPSTPDYQCDKPVSELSMFWNGDTAIRVVAHKGKLTDPVIADLDYISPGTEVRVEGYSGSPNDVIWEIFAAGSNSKIGESAFHVSCSDDDMDGPEDCGMAAGDGKNNDKCTGGDGSCLKTWLFEGLKDKNGEINCTQNYPTDPVANGSSTCEIVGPGEMNLQYDIVNTGTGDLELISVVDSVLGNLPDLPSGALAPGETHTINIADTIADTTTRNVSVDAQESGRESLCTASTVISTLVVPPAPPCESMLVLLDDKKHDELKLMLYNESDQNLEITAIEIAWPEEHVELKEIKIDGDGLMKTVTAWEPVSEFSEDDFLLDASEKTIESGENEKLEFKFDEHVHDSPQEYEINVEFTEGCSVIYNDMGG